MIKPEDVKFAASKLKLGKSDGSLPMTSNNIIHATDVLYGHLSILFTAMLKHGVSPHGMLVGTMVPLPKGRWNNLNNSKNFRAITISSLFGKLLDIIILQKEAPNLLTNDLQFSYKSGSSTTMCSTMIRETISYFNHKGSNVYGLVLDATKAFDRINYCKLFNILLERNICPLICRLLLNMYTNQKLRVRWGTTYSNEFNVSNGVKQGGVISPILFCVYMDKLLNELKLSHVGCYMGAIFVGAFMYADDLKLLAPSIYALNVLLDICIKFARKYDVLFNDKSELIVYRSRDDVAAIPDIKINGKQVKVVNSITHLGHVLNDNIFKSDSSKCIRDFNIQCNSFLADFKHSISSTRNHLFFKYCTSFYGSVFLPIYDNTMDEVYKAWRIAVRKVWRVPWTTHCDLLPHLAGVMPPNLSFEKNAISFINLLLKSENSVVKTVTGMGLHGYHSILGQNIKYLKAKYELKSHNISTYWKTICHVQQDLIRQCNQIRELCHMRDTYHEELLTRAEIKEIINTLCTE